MYLGRDMRLCNLAAGSLQILRIGKAEGGMAAPSTVALRSTVEEIYLAKYAGGSNAGYVFVPAKVCRTPRKVGTARRQHL